MILLRSVIFLALVGTGVWYFLAEPDRRAELAALDKALNAEAELRQDSLTETLQKFELATVLVARSAPVAALLEEKPAPEVLPQPVPNAVNGPNFGIPVAPPVVAPENVSNERALDDLRSLEAPTGLGSVRILKKGEMETLPALTPPAALLADGSWQALIETAFQGAMGRAAFDDDKGNPFYFFFTPYFSKAGVLAIIIAEAPLSDEKSRWEKSDYRLALTGADGKVVLSNATKTGNDAIEVSRDIPALNAVITVATAKPGPFGPWAVRSGAVVLIAFLVLMLWELYLARRRLLSEAAEARLIKAMQKEPAVAERTAGPDRTGERLPTGESLPLLGQVSALIAQEIDPPLSAIRSCAGAALRSVERGDTDVAQQNIRQVSNLADRISRIVGNMRGFGTSQAYQIEPVSIRPVVHDAAVNMLERDPGLGDFFFMEVADDLPDKAFVRADKTRLSQVIDTLLSSSWDACREQEEPELVISIQQSGDNIIVAIDYSGRAGDEGDQVPVERVTRASKPGGAGVSFSIAESFVEGMGGRLVHKDSALGGGRSEIILPKFRTNTV